MAVTVFYANQNMQDIGVLKGFKLDMTVSMETGDNDFEVRTSIDGIEMDEGYYIYVEGSEYGGIIDTKRINTKDKTLYYSGRTWRGMLESKIIQPPSGQDYYKASGDLNVVLDTLIDDFGLSDLFYADSVMTGVEVTDYQFYRYTDVYSGIIRLLSNLDYKLAIEFDTSELKCKIGAVSIVDYGENQEVTSDLYDFDIKRVGGTVNHLIGLGAGELKDRLVIHKYADTNGVISDIQTLFDKDEIVAIYDYGNAESREELEEKMLEQFQNMIGSDDIQITLNEINLDVGDKVTAYEEKTEIEAIQYIQSKVVTIDDETINVQHSAKTVQISEHGEIRKSSSESPSMQKLDDVSLSSLSDGQILKYNSQNTKWENEDLNLNALSDVSLSSLVNGQILQYDSTNQKWKNVNLGGGASAVDYVIEQHSVSDRGYTIWNSGKLECWIRITTTVSSTTAWGNIRYGSRTGINYPKAFVGDYPVVTITCQASYGSVWASPAYDDYSLTNTGTIYVYSADNRSNIKVTMNVYAVGRWK